MTRRIGYGSAIVHHPETNMSYEIGCTWKYYYEPPTYDHPGDESFETDNHTLIAIEGEPPLDCYVPDWINWEDYEDLVKKQYIG